MSLEGKVAVVTGGGRELGKAAATGLARAGANVVIAEIEDYGAETAREISSIGSGCTFVKTDVSKRTDVERMVAKAIEAHGRIDILVNNAAIYPYRPWVEISEEEWDRVFAVNVKGQFLCSQCVVPHMKRAWERQDHQLGVGHVLRRVPQLPALLVDEGSRCGFHSDPCAGTRGRQHQCQRHLSGRISDQGRNGHVLWTR